MSKALAGAAMLGGAFAMGALAALDPAVLVSPLYGKIIMDLVVGGISMEAGAIASALTQQRGQNITTRQPASARQIIYGTQRVGGVIVYQSTTGSHYDQYNMVIVLATHEIEAIENLYLDGRRVYWNSGVGNTTRNGYNFGGSAATSGGIDGGGTYIGPDGAHYNFGTLVYCEARFGDQSDGDVIGGLTANDPKWAASGGQAPWLGGCAYVYLKVEYDAAMFPQMPEIRFTVHGKNNIYDPRTSTSGYSTNAALIAADILSDSIWGLGSPTVNQAQLIAAANICDEAITCAAGSEARYAAHWHYDTTTPPGEALKVFLAAMGGRITRSGGEWFLWPAAWVGPSASFDENVLLAPPDWHSYRRPEDLINRVNGTYIAPNYPYSVAGDLYDSNGWYAGSIANQFPFAFQPSNFPQYAADTLHGYPSDAYLAADGGVALPLELELKAVLSVSQAQRLAKIALMRNRQQGSGLLRMKISAFDVVGIDVIQMTFAQLGWSDYQLEVSGEPRLALDPGEVDQFGKLVRAPYFYLEVPVQDTSADVYAWTPSSEELTPYDVPAYGGMAPYTPAAPTSVTLDSGASTAIVGADGVTIPRVAVSWTDPLDALVIEIQIQFRLTGSSNPWQNGPAVAVGLGEAFVMGVVAGQAYDFRLRSIRARGAFSGWVEVDGYTVSSTLSIIKSTGLNPGSPYNVNNDAVLDSIVDGSGTHAEIRIYGPSGVGSAWDNKTGQGTTSYPAGSVSGLLFSTVYFVAYDTVGLSYVTSTTINGVLSDSYILLGALTTVASGGTGGVSGGGGGYGGGTGGGGPRSVSTL